LKNTRSTRSLSRYSSFLCEPVSSSAPAQFPSEQRLALLLKAYERNQVTTCVTYCSLM
jgi:hypothetical protein